MSLSGRLERYRVPAVSIAVINDYRVERAGATGWWRQEEVNESHQRRSFNPPSSERSLLPWLPCTMLRTVLLSSMVT